MPALIVISDRFTLDFVRPKTRTKQIYRSLLVNIVPARILGYDWVKLPNRRLDFALSSRSCNCVCHITLRVE